jgi:endonuclease YncB( thermonuclease family)
MLGPELAEQLESAGLLTRAERQRVTPRWRGFRRFRWRHLLIPVAALAFVATRWQASAPRGGGDMPEGRYKVSRVLSGERLELTNGVEVRLLGVRPREDKRLAAAALEFTQTFVAGGEVRLQFDRTRIDPDGRYLAYVWSDGPPAPRLLNEELLRTGLGSPAPETLALCSSSMKRRLTKAAEAARK